MQLFVEEKGRDEKISLRLHQPNCIQVRKDICDGCSKYHLGVKWEEKRGTEYEEGTCFCI